MTSIKISVRGALARTLLFCITAIVTIDLAEAEAIRGQVQDALGRPISEATLNLKNSDGEVIVSTQSDASGGFLFPGISQNTYELDVDKNGFQQGISIVTVVP